MMGMHMSYTPHNAMAEWQMRQANNIELGLQLHNEAVRRERMAESRANSCWGCGAYYEPGRGCYYCGSGKHD
jgi:rRNA maturation endonuclease Nob1